MFRYERDVSISIDMRNICLKCLLAGALSGKRLTCMHGVLRVRLLHGRRHMANARILLRTGVLNRTFDAFQAMYS